MQPAEARPAAALSLPRPRRRRRSLASAFSRRRRRLLLRRLTRDAYFAYTVALTLIAVVVIAAYRDPTGLFVLGGLATLFIGSQAALSLVPPQKRRLSVLTWSFVRLALTLLYVAAIVELGGGATGPLVALFLPVVVAAAALGGLQAAVIGGVAAIIYLVPELSRMGTTTELALRGVALAGVSMVLAFGTRQLVLTVEQTSRRLGSAVLAEQRRSRQIAGLEEVSRLLVSSAPTAELLDSALEVLVDRFGYQYVSIYLTEGDRLVLGAQRGYERPPAAFDGTAGVVGRVMRTHELAYVPDVRRDPDYIAVFDGVVSEICAPLMMEDQFQGILNVEAGVQLDRTDRDLVATLAGRVATVVTLGRDRQALSERAAVFRSLHEFTQAVSGTLELDRLAASMVDAARHLVRSDIAALTVLERASGRYRVMAVTDMDPSTLGGEVRPGEGLSGRAIRDRTIVIDDQFTVESVPRDFRPLADHPIHLLGAGIPLIRDGVVVGALSLLRNDPTDAFRPIEREAMELLGGHAALALANAFLHAEVEQLAIRDPLTGLYNRRHFDEALDRLLAGWHRALPDARPPVAVIMLDLDHFGDFNKRHGHQVGDLVLRSFAGILRNRFRASDLVARMGGEEFVVVLEGATREDAERVAEEVRVALGSLNLSNEDGERLSVTVSGGCAQLDESQATREQLLRTADVALFMAKRAGRDRVVSA
jgi:diguanylate cyclase (GGDEF)-like protein